jgi:hypothetical protein
MANPNPSPATRFQKGKSGHEGHFGPYRKTISRSLHVASLAEAQAKPNAFKGTPRDFLLAAMTDPDVDYQVRLAAGALLRNQPDGGGKNLGELLREVAERRGITYEQARDERIHELATKSGYRRVLTIDAERLRSTRASPRLAAPVSQPAYERTNGCEGLYTMETPGGPQEARAAPHVPAPRR